MSQFAYVFLAIIQLSIWGFIVRILKMKSRGIAIAFSIFNFMMAGAIAALTLYGDATTSMYLVLIYIALNPGIQLIVIRKLENWNSQEKSNYRV